MRSTFRRPARAQGGLVLAAAVAGSLVFAAGVRPSAAQQQFLQQVGQTGAAAVKKVLGGQPSSQPASPAGQPANPAGIPPSGSPSGGSPSGGSPSGGSPSGGSPSGGSLLGGSQPGGIVGRVEQVGEAAATKLGGQKAGNYVQTAGRVVNGARTVVQKVRSKGKPAASSPSPPQAAAPQQQPVPSSPAAPPPPPPTPRPAGPRPPGAPPP